MAVYLFQNPDTGEVKEIFQQMSDPHTYEEDGKEWKRIFTIPRASIDMNINPMSHADWNRKTENKRGTIGDMMDRSRELSEQRERIVGKDPVKEKLFEDHKKKYRGKYHPEDPKRNEESKKVFEKLGVEVSQ